MAVPSVMADISSTANSNSPAGTESPSNADDFLRAIQAILRATESKGSDIASATTTDIGAATGGFVDVTGTTTITGLGTVAAGIVRTVRFTGVLTLTHNATSLQLPGSANITTANGDMAIFRSLGSGNWKCVSYVRQNGQPVVLGGTASADITMSSASMIWAKGADVASASALPLITDGNYFDVTGTTTITSFNSMGVGTWIGLQFDGVLTLTHNATDLILPGAANITTAAGDEAIFVEYASGDWRCVAYTRADGKQVVGALTSGTPATTTSGTTHDFTGIPSWVKKITVNFAGVSSSGTSNWLIQIGDSGGIENTGYLGAGTAEPNGSAQAIANFTAGFGIRTAIAANILHGSVVLTLLDASTNTWCATGGLANSNAAEFYDTAGSKSLSATLDRVRLTTVNGSDTFDAGTVNITYE
jgi:hypothetical protein